MPLPGTSFCASLRGRNRHGHLTRAILCRFFSMGPPGVSDITSMENRALTVTAGRTLQCGHTVWGTGQALKQELGTPPKDPCQRGRSPQPRPHRAHAGPAGVRLHPRGTSGGAFLGSVGQLPSGPPCCHYLLLEKRWCFFHNVTCIWVLA